MKLCGMLLNVPGKDVPALSLPWIMLPETKVQLCPASLARLILSWLQSAMMGAAIAINTAPKTVCNRVAFGEWRMCDVPSGVCFACKIIL